MTKNINLNKLVEEIIRESKRPFTIKDFAKNLETRWQKQISDSSLKKVRQILLNHHSLIGIKENDFVPCRAVVEKINHVSLSVPLGTWELKQGMLIPGHRLMPFLLANERLVYIEKLYNHFNSGVSFYKYGNFSEACDIFSNILNNILRKFHRGKEKYRSGYGATYL